MKFFRHRLAAWMAVGALAATSLFAAQTSPAGGHTSPTGGHGHGRFGAFLSTYLNLTDTQQTQAKSIFQDARQSAQPIHQELQQTRQSLRAAIQANNTAQIQQLSTTEGSEIGQLAAIRGTAMAKVYQILTPDQQQKLATLQQARKAGHHTPAADAQN